MTRRSDDRHDPMLDLVLERTIDIPRELVWKAWTRPEHVKKWWDSTRAGVDASSLR